MLNMPPGRKAGESHVPFIGVSFTGLETLTKLHNRLGPDIRLMPVDRAKHLASDFGVDIRAEAEAALRLAADTDKLTAAGAKAQVQPFYDLLDAKGSVGATSANP